MDYYIIVDGEFVQLTPEQVAENQAKIDAENVRQKGGKLIIMSDEEIAEKESSRLPTLEELIKESEAIRDELLENNAVEIRPSIFLRTRLKDYPIFDDLLKRLSPGDVYPNFTQEYPRGTFKVFDVSYEEFEAAYEQGALQQMQIRQAHGERVKQIQGS